MILTDFWFLLDVDFESENTFVQEYVDDPYLIDGRYDNFKCWLFFLVEFFPFTKLIRTFYNNIRRFDIGVYATITSINPLRIYVNNGDWLVRWVVFSHFFA